MEQSRLNMYREQSMREKEERKKKKKKKGRDTQILCNATDSGGELERRPLDEITKHDQQEQYWRQSSCCGENAQGDRDFADVSAITQPPGLRPPAAHPQ